MPLHQRGLSDFSLLALAVLLLLASLTGSVAQADSLLHFGSATPVPASSYASPEGDHVLNFGFRIRVRARTDAALSYDETFDVGRVETIAFGQPILIDDSTAAGWGIDWEELNNLLAVQDNYLGIETGFWSSIDIPGGFPRIGESGMSSTGVAIRGLDSFVVTPVSFSKTLQQNGLYRYAAQSTTYGWIVIPEPSTGLLFVLAVVGLYHMPNCRKKRW
jgi:hypothetical protein